MIVHKLLFFREGRSEKHLDDIRAMLDADSVPDREELQGWIRRLAWESSEWALVEHGR